MVSNMAKYLCQMNDLALWAITRIGEAEALD